MTATAEDLQAEVEFLRTRVAELEAKLDGHRERAADLIAQSVVRDLPDRGDVLATAFHASPSGITVTELETGELIEANETFVQIAGYRREEMLGRSTAELGLWMDASQRADLIAQVRRRGLVRGVEVQLRAKRDRVVTAKVSAEVIDCGGRSAVLTTWEDVTSRKLAERAYRESRRRYRTLARLAPVGIFYADAKGWPRYVNDHWCRITGLTAERTMEEGWTQAVHAADRVRVAAEWEEAVARGESFRSEFRFERPDGQTVWVLGMAEPEHGSDGAVASFVATVTDITAEKDAALALLRMNEELESRVRQRTEALQASEAKWRSLVESAPDYIFVLERDGSIRFINHTLPQFTPDQIVGTAVYEYLPPEHHDRVRQLLARVAETGEAATYEFDAVRLDGQRRWYVGRVGPIRCGETVTSLIVIASDVTRQKEAEETARRRQDELAHVARLNTMGEMVSVIAHELNNPLAAIANYAHGCVRRLEAKRIHRAGLKDALEGIAGQATRAGETIRRLRGFLQKRDAFHDAVEPRRLVDEAAQLVGPEVRRHRVRVRVQVADALPAVLADAVQIEQVLVNLLLNGLEAMQDVEPEKRVLTVGTVAGESGQVVFCVRDSGRGVLPEHAARIFEPFFTTKERGLGMGLSISRSIVEAHGGRLWASSEEPGGAAFRFSLPAWTGGKG